MQKPSRVPKNRGIMIGDRLAWARKRAGMSQRQLADNMGARYDQTMISHVETGRSGFVGDGISKAAETLGVSIDYLFGLTDDPTPSNLLAQRSTEGYIDSSEVVIVPKVAAIVGEDMGGNQFDETILDHLPLPRKWLTEVGVYHDKCQLVIHKGEWMEPDLPDGCTIVVDKESTEYKHNKVFLVHFEQDVLEKTAQYLTPVRILWETRVQKPGEEYWTFRFDKNRDARPSGWPIAMYDVKRIIGEVVLVVAVP